mgnify:FL=1
MKEKVNFIVAIDRYENLSPLNNRINFIIVNCLQHVILFMLGLNQHLPCQCIHKSSFLEQIMKNGPDIIHFKTWVSS